MGIVNGGVGGAAFNGGTITQPLVVDTRPDDVTVPLHLRSGDPATQGFNITFDPSLPGATFQAIDASGSWTFSDDFSTNTVFLSAGGATVSDGTNAVTTTPVGVQSAATTGKMGYFAPVTFANLAMLTAQGVLIGVHAAPADGAINAGEAYVWFDQTNGAAKLMVKAKTANGTVATGSVTLT